MNEFKSTLKDLYPNAATAIEEHDFSHLVGPENISLPNNVKKRVQKFVAEVFEATRTQTYLELISSSLSQAQQKLLLVNPKQASVLMAYDFHWIPQTEELKLIEINTNASGFLISDALYRHKNMNTWDSSLESLKSSFQSELKLNPPQIAIIDETLDSQKMFIEFILFNELFKSWGWSSEIKDYSDLKFDSPHLTSQLQKFNFIYNRYCDFDFQEERSKELLRAYLSEDIIFSPNPKEYLLLAHKPRLSLLSQPDFFEKILGLDEEEVRSYAQMFCRSFDITDFVSFEDLWAQRSQFFFKPKDSYGGKMVYKGSSISRKKLESIYDDRLFIQEFAPPAKHYSESTGQIYKYDLRFYAYGPIVQLGVARLYQGQATNFKTAGGGFSTLSFSS